MKCQSCGATVGGLKKYVPIRNGAICKKCFERLGFDYKDKDKYATKRYDDIACGYGAYMKKQTQPAPRPTERIELSVAGFDFKQKELKSLLTEPNDDYKLSKKAFLEDVAERTYQYETERYPAMLVPEPDNEYDANAIAIYVEDVHIGYIAKKDQKKIDLARIASAEVEIYGGKYKDIDFTGYEEEIVTGETPYKAKLNIKLKKEA